MVSLDQDSLCTGTCPRYTPWTDLGPLTVAFWLGPNLVPCGQTKRVDHSDAAVHHGVVGVHRRGVVGDHPRETAGPHDVVGGHPHDVVGDRPHGVVGDHPRETAGPHGVVGDRRHDAADDHPRETADPHDVVGDRRRDAADDHPRETADPHDVVGDRHRGVAGDRHRGVVGDRRRGVVGDRRRGAADDYPRETAGPHGVVGGHHLDAVGDRHHDAAGRIAGYPRFVRAAMAGGCSHRMICASHTSRSSVVADHPETTTRVVVHPIDSGTEDSVRARSSDRWPAGARDRTAGVSAWNSSAFFVAQTIMSFHLRGVAVPHYHRVVGGCLLFGEVCRAAYVRYYLVDDVAGTCVVPIIVVCESWRCCYATLRRNKGDRRRTFGWRQHL